MSLTNQTILVTGCAGFIGSHLCEKLLLNSNNKVIGLDNLDPYYSVERKIENMKILEKFSNFQFLEEDIRTTCAITDFKPDTIVHLASLAGVRNSLLEPERYAEVNIIGMIHLLEQFRLLKECGNRKFIFASSSSVYGTNQKVPFEETDELNNINSPYAASKRAMEIYGQTYSQLYQLNIIGLRFFTVYGPRGRPDMAPYKFMNAIKEGKEITKYGSGNSFRDYTYISDIVQGIEGAIQVKKDGFEVYNLGNGNPITLNEFIGTCAKVLTKEANIKEIEEQEGDVPGTYCSKNKAERDLGYKPKVKLEEGLENISK
jgi:UDP-glucuronate 4-epimerase